MQMKYIKLFEDYFSIFPSNYFETTQDLEIELNNILVEVCNNFKDYSITDGTHGGKSISNKIDCITYVIKEFNSIHQEIIIEIYDGIEARLHLSTLNLKSQEFKKGILTDIKKRFNIDVNPL
jgi:hypothetical protein